MPLNQTLGSISRSPGRQKKSPLVNTANKQALAFPLHKHLHLWLHESWDHAHHTLLHAAKFMMQQLFREHQGCNYAHFGPTASPAASAGLSLSFEVGILQPSQSLHPGDMDMSCIRSCSTQ